MIIVDAQLSPALAPWISTQFKVDARAVRDIGLRDAEDREIFDAARAMDAIVLTKDVDFVEMLERLGPPPKVIWLTCGNTSNKNLRAVLEMRLTEALSLLAAGEPLVEISGA